MSKRTFLRNRLEKEEIKNFTLFHFSPRRDSVFAVRTIRNKNILKVHCQSLMIEISFFAFADMRLLTTLGSLPVSLIPWKINRWIETSRYMQ